MNENSYLNPITIKEQCQKGSRNLEKDNESIQLAEKSLKEFVEDKEIKGKAFDAYKNLGAHICDTGVLFRTYAPNAKGVNLLHGGNEIPMYRAEN